MRFTLFISVAILAFQSVLTNPPTDNLKNLVCTLKERIEPSKEFAVIQYKSGSPLENSDAEDNIISSRLINSTSYNLSDDETISFFWGNIEGSKVIEYNYLISLAKSNTTVEPTSDKNTTLAKLEQIGDKLAPLVRPALDELQKFNNSGDCLKAISDQIEALQLNETYEVAAFYRLSSLLIDTCIGLNCKNNTNATVPK